MTISSGTKLGRYEILSQLGKGGMGVRSGSFSRDRNAARRLPVLPLLVLLVCFMAAGPGNSALAAPAAYAMAA